MGNSKKTSIYKPKKGRNVSQKNLYKMPQKGGGILDFFMGGDEEGKVDASPVANEETEGADQSEEGAEVEAEGETKVEGEEVEAKVEGEEVEAKVEEGTKVEEEVESEVEDEEGDKGLLSTVITSATDTVGELQTAFTTPTNDSLDLEDNTLQSLESTPEASATNNIDTIESLQQDKTNLLQEMNELHKTIESLQQEKIDNLQRPDILPDTPGITPDSDEPSIIEKAPEENYMGVSPNGESSYSTGPSPNEESPDSMGVSPNGESSYSTGPSPNEESPDSMGVSPMDEGQKSIDVSSPEESQESMGVSPMDEGQNSMDISSMEGPSELENTPVNIETQDVSPGAPVNPENENSMKQGGTKRHKNKRRRTKRKRKTSNK
jgi:hypothetical protein